ncbi:hypothetical protein ABZ897_43215 [Nonomuraea sp. NPDC046802]|uniref:hypothetical protein n=1 Tax=Nonomuraea sp. NPDC046802 TaxID=3154919 RepID=UPI003411F28A
MLPKNRSPRIFVTREPSWECHPPAADHDRTAGWLTVEGRNSLRVSLTIAFDQLSDIVLDPGPGWPALYGSFEEMVAANRAAADFPHIMAGNFDFTDDKQIILTFTQTDDIRQAFDTLHRDGLLIPMTNGLLLAPTLAKVIDET